MKAPDVPAAITTAVEVEGTQRRADMVRAHWEARGYDVATKVVPIHGAILGRSVIMGIRSNMVNGLPPAMGGRCGWAELEK